MVPFYYLFKLRGKFDVVIDDENGIPFFAPLFAKEPVVGIMHHVHKEVFFKELPFFVAWIPYLIERSMPLFYSRNRFIAVSETTKKEMVKIGFKKENISIIPNGLNHNELLRSYGKSEHPTILYLGRIKKYKRLNLLIEAFKEIYARIPSATLEIAGDGDGMNELRESAKDLPVNFHGFVSDKEKVKLLQSSWVFANPSFKEGWGISVLEANACFTPSVVFDVPGLRDAVHDGKSGFLAKDMNDFVSKIELILKDEKLRKELQESAYEWSLNFSWDDSAERSLRLMEEVVR